MPASLPSITSTLALPEILSASRSLTVVPASYALIFSALARRVTPAQHRAFFPAFDLSVDHLVPRGFVETDPDDRLAAPAGVTEVRKIAVSELASSLIWEVWSRENVCCRTGARRRSEEHQPSAGTNQDQ